MRALFAALLLLAPFALAPAASALPTPGLFCENANAATGRYFPEARESNDFVSYAEARQCLDALAKQNPDWLKIDVIGKSVGWDVVTGGHDKFDVFVVKVTNHKSNVSDADKTRLVFQLSIHGNEKGGREGGLRVIEDFARNIGMAQEHPELRKMLDWMELLFVFPNPDGWNHEEIQYRANDACYFSVTNTCGKTGVESQNFVRVNGNGSDVNRQFPTVGWACPCYKAMHEPEAIGVVDYLRNVPNLKYASDIHGMLNPADGTTPAADCASGARPPDVGGFDPTCFQNAATGARGHFILTMIPAGRMDPEEMVQNTALAELVKQRLNGDPYFAAWQTAPTSAQGAWGGEFDGWGTVWDTLGYTDSGFTSDWYAQDSGLNVPGVDFEMAYNHITVDDYYPGAGMVFNDYHVQAVRDIVRAFMDQAAQDVSAHVESNGLRTAWLKNPVEVTNEGNQTLPDWAKDNAADDAYDAAHKVYHARPDDYWVDLAAKLKHEGKPGVLVGLTADDVRTGKLDGYDNFVVTNSTTEGLDAAAVAKIQAWTQKGGHLLLTDGAMRLMPALGVAKEGSVGSLLNYAGHTNFVNTKHPLAQGIRGLARETFEPVPLGFPISKLSAPNWFVQKDGFQGDAVGVVGVDQAGTPDAKRVNYGEAKLGEGKVVFLGALLPTPANGENVPYGVDAYATTYTGNQLVRNALGFAEVVSTQPAVPGAPVKAAPTSEPAKGVPDVALPLVALALVGTALLLRRRS